MIPFSKNGHALPALAVLELSEMAAALPVVDAVVKRAEVQLLMADPVTPGKVVVIFAGAVAEVSESFEAGREAATHRLLDSLLLPGVHPELVECLEPFTSPPVVESLGVLEMGTVAATLLAADAALKEAEVHLLTLKLARGIGGKGVVVFTGRQPAVEASLEAGDLAVEPALRIGREIVINPHPEVDWMLGRFG